MKGQKEPWSKWTYFVVLFSCHVTCYIGIIVSLALATSTVQSWRQHNAVDQQIIQEWSSFTTFFGHFHRRYSTCITCMSDSLDLKQSWSIDKPVVHLWTSGFFFIVFIIANYHLIIIVIITTPHFSINCLLSESLSSITCVSRYHPSHPRLTRLHLPLTNVCAIFHCDLSSSNYGMAQSRGRVYILMVRKDLTTEDHLDAIVRCIEAVFPKAFPAKETVPNVRSFVEIATTAIHGSGYEFKHPLPSKVLWLQGPLCWRGKTKTLVTRHGTRPWKPNWLSLGTPKKLKCSSHSDWRRRLFVGVLSTPGGSVDARGFGRCLLGACGLMVLLLLN